jgi:hypothetical protein
MRTKSAAPCPAPIGSQGLTIDESANKTSMTRATLSDEHEVIALLKVAAFLVLLSFFIIKQTSKHAYN